MNILVSPTMGGVTGIIDWAEADILPFGLALYGLKTYSDTWARKDGVILRSETRSNRGCGSNSRIASLVPPPHETIANGIQQ